jgi:hypothetical protein
MYGHLTDLESENRPIHRERITHYFGLSTSCYMVRLSPRGHSIYESSFQSKVDVYCEILIFFQKVFSHCAIGYMMQTVVLDK